MLKCRKLENVERNQISFSTQECVNRDQFLPNYITEQWVEIEIPLKRKIKRNSFDAEKYLPAI